LSDIGGTAIRLYDDGNKFTISRPTTIRAIACSKFLAPSLVSESVVTVAAAVPTFTSTVDFSDYSLDVQISSLSQSAPGFYVRYALNATQAELDGGLLNCDFNTNTTLFTYGNTTIHFYGLPASTPATVKVTDLGFSTVYAKSCSGGPNQKNLNDYSSSNVGLIGSAITTYGVFVHPPPQPIVVAPVLSAGTSCIRNELWTMTINSATITEVKNEVVTQANEYLTWTMTIDSAGITEVQDVAVTQASQSGTGTLTTALQNEYTFTIDQPSLLLQLRVQQ
jgi:hypothetical protein